MSEIMIGVLRMPDDLFWAEDTITRMQHNAIRKEAADEIDRLSASEQLADSYMETFVAIADYLCIDADAARSAPGKPSGVFIGAIQQRERGLREALVNLISAVNHTEYGSALSGARKALAATDHIPGAAVDEDGERFRYLEKSGAFRVMSPDMSGNHTWVATGRTVGSGKNIRDAIDKARKGGE